MTDQMKTMPTKPVSEFQTISGNLLDGIVAAHMDGFSIPAQVHKDVGKGRPIEVGHDGVVVRVIAKPVMHDKHAFRSGSMLHVA